MDILIESIKDFENDLKKFNLQDREAIVEKINYCANLFPDNKVSVYRRMRRLNTAYSLNGYKSSLYTLRVSPKIRVILTIDEDPIFDQTIFTLFRVVQIKDLDLAYQKAAESLYQDLLNHNQEVANIS